MKKKSKNTFKRKVDVVRSRQRIKGCAADAYLRCFTLLRFILRTGIRVL